MIFNLSTVLTILVATATPLVSALPNGLAAAGKGIEARDLAPRHGDHGNARSHSGFGRWNRGRKGNRKTRSCSAPSTTTVVSGEAPPSDPTTVAATTTQEPAPPASPAPTEEPSSSQEESPAPESPAPAPAPSAPSNSDPSVQAYLDAHNGERANHGANALTWADDLAQSAQSWANGCVFKHSGGPTGENLSAGTSMTPSGAVQLWLDEAPDYNPSNPQYSHWTQVVWKNTKELGCAVANCPISSIFSGATGSGTASFYVCEYRPAGNVIGQFAANVQA